MVVFLFQIGTCYSSFKFYKIIIVKHRLLVIQLCFPRWEHSALSSVYCSVYYGLISLSTCIPWLKFHVFCLYLPRSIIPADLAFFGGWVGSNTTDIHTTGFLFTGRFLPLYWWLYSRTIVFVSVQKLVQYIHLFITSSIVRKQQTSQCNFYFNLLNSLTHKCNIISSSNSYKWTTRHATHLRHLLAIFPVVSDYFRSPWPRQSWWFHSSEYYQLIIWFSSRLLSLLHLFYLNIQWLNIENYISNYWNKI